MAVVRPRAEDVETLICETCQWVEPRSSLVIEMWSNEVGRDFCEICTAKRAVAQAKRDGKKAA